MKPKKPKNNMKQQPKIETWFMKQQQEEANNKPKQENSKTKGQKKK